MVSFEKSSHSIWLFPENICLSEERFTALYKTRTFWHGLIFVFRHDSIMFGDSFCLTALLANMLFSTAWRVTYSLLLEDVLVLGDFYRRS